MSTDTDPAVAGGELQVSFRDAFEVWLKIGWLSFGGPAGQIALMHRMLVEERRWIDESRFLHALNYCMLLPGPEAQQLATYVGWLLHGLRGAVAAGVLFVLPGAFVMLGLSLLYVQFQDIGSVQALFLGIKAAVLAVVVQAVLRLGRRVLKNRAMLVLAGAGFIGIFVFEVSFPLIVASAAAAGFIGGRWWPERFEVLQTEGEGRLTQERSVAGGRSGLRRAVLVTVVCLALWLGPTAALLLALGPDHVYALEGLFFSKLAVVTFGGAYAVLAYMAQQAVETFGWLAAGEMLDGLGLAESTPGPLIMVVQFVGFLGAYRDPGALAPATAGVLGSLLATWVTFMPCFLWILLGAPYIETLRHSRLLSAALSAITAVVVGVILNLGIWFGLHVVFHEVATASRFGMHLPSPAWGSLDPVALVLAASALVALLRLRLGVIRTLAACAMLALGADLLLA